MNIALHIFLSYYYAIILLLIFSSVHFPLE